MRFRVRVKYRWHHPSAHVSDLLQFGVDVPERQRRHGFWVCQSAVSSRSSVQVCNFVMGFHFCCCLLLPAVDAVVEGSGHG